MDKLLTVIAIVLTIYSASLVAETLDIENKTMYQNNYAREYRLQNETARLLKIK